MFYMISLTLSGTAFAEDLNTVLVSDFSGATSESSLEVLSAHTVEILTPLLSEKSIVRETQDDAFRKEHELPETCEDISCSYLLGTAMQSQYVIRAHISKERSKFVCTFQLLDVATKTEISVHKITETTTSGIDAALASTLELLIQDMKSHEEKPPEPPPSEDGFFTKLVTSIANALEPAPEPTDDLGQPTEEIDPTDSTTEENTETTKIAKTESTDVAETDNVVESKEETESTAVPKSIEENTEVPPPFHGLRTRVSLGTGAFSFKQSSKDAGLYLPLSASYLAPTFLPHFSSELLILNKFSLYYAYNYVLHSAEVVETFKMRTPLSQVRIAYRTPLGKNQYAEYGLSHINTYANYFTYNSTRTDAANNDVYLGGVAISAAFVSRGLAGQLMPLSLRASFSETFSSNHLDVSVPRPVTSSIDIDIDYKYKQLDQVVDSMVISLNSGLDMAHFKTTTSDEEGWVRGAQLSLMGGVGVLW